MQKSFKKIATKFRYWNEFPTWIDWKKSCIALLNLITAERARGIELNKETWTIGLLFQSVAGWLLWGNTLYVCAVGCAVNLNKESFITTNSSQTTMPISCLGFGCKIRMHCDEDKQHREMFVAFHRKLFAQDPDWEPSNRQTLNRPIRTSPQSVSS